MEDDSLDRFRLALMQDFLPVSLAMIDRVRQGGPGKVVEAFNSSNDPFQELRDEGENSAKNIRDRLDQVFPGLGNPVVSVSVAVDNSETFEIQDVESLREILVSIESKLDNVQTLLDAEPGELPLSKDKL